MEVSLIMKKILFITMLFFTTVVFAENLKVKQDANLRYSPDINSDVITIIKSDSVVDGQISSEYPDWYEITYNETLGYIHSSLIEENLDNGLLLKVFIILVVSIILLIISMKVAIINRICTILFNVVRMVFAIMCINSVGFLANLNYLQMAVIFGCITAFLTLYAIGSSAFDDTREETGNVLLNPIEGGGYKVTSEITGNSPLGNFLNAIIWSGAIGWLTGYILLNLEDTMFVGVIFLAIIGLIKGIISLIKLIKL